MSANFDVTFLEHEVTVSARPYSTLRHVLCVWSVLQTCFRTCHCFSSHFCLVIRFGSFLMLNFLFSPSFRRATSGARPTSPLVPAVSLQLVEETRRGNTIAASWFCQVCAQRNVTMETVSDILVHCSVSQPVYYCFSNIFRDVLNSDMFLHTEMITQCGDKSAVFFSPIISSHRPVQHWKTFTANTSFYLISSCPRVLQFRCFFIC
jgi:hypothetical protein